MSQKKRNCEFRTRIQVLAAY